MRRNWWGIVMGCMILGAGICVITPVCYGEEEDTIEYEYDELNRVVEAVYPDGSKVIYSYDENGNLTGTTVIPPEEASTASTEREENTSAGVGAENSTNGNVSGSQGTGGDVVVEDNQKEGDSMESGGQGNRNREGTEGKDRAVEDGAAEAGVGAKDTGAESGASGIEEPVGTTGYGESAESSLEQEEKADGRIWWPIAILVAAAAGGIVWITGRRKHHEKAE